MNVPQQRRAALLRPLLADLDQHDPPAQIESQLRTALHAVCRIEHAGRARKRKAAKKARRHNRKG